MVRVRDIGVVREVYDEGRGGPVGRGSEVRCVAAEEGGAGVEAEVDEGVYVGNGGKGCAVAYRAEGALVGLYEGGAIWPVVGGVGAVVVCEDYVDVSGGLNQGVERDILVVEAAVNKGEGGGVVVDGVACWVPAVEGVGSVTCDVVVVFVKTVEDSDDCISCEGWNVAITVVDLENERIE